MSDFDHKKYKEDFFAVLKTPPVILPVIFSVIGIIVAVSSSFIDVQRIKYVVAIVGCLITMAGGEMINLNIRKGMNQKKSDNQK